MSPGGELTYALEGAIFVTGAAVQWLRDGLGLIGSAAESEALAATVPDSGGVVFVPALTGLGAPDWDPSARGTILGITRGTTRAHLVRATLEAIAFEVRDVVELLPRITTLRVDGGAAANGLLLQLQADTARACRSSGPRCWRPPGSARRSSPGSAPASGRRPTSSPRPGGSTGASSRAGADQDARDAAYRRWRAAVERAKGWATD